MKNNKLLYLLTIFITLFTFNINANAAQELTCIYKAYPGEKNDSIALVQYVTGKKAIYSVNYEENISDDGSASWQRMHQKIVFYQNQNENTSLKSSTELKSCPEAVKYFPDIRDLEYRFYINDTRDEKNYKDYLYFNKEYAKVPEYALAQTMEPKHTNDPSTGDLIQLEKSPYTGEPYTGICKYRKNVGENETHYIQVNIGKKDILFTELDPGKDGYAYSGMGDAFLWEAVELHKFAINSELTPDKFYKKGEENEGECPSQLRVSRLKTVKDNYIDTMIFNDVTNSSRRTTSYVLYDVSGNNPITGEKLTTIKSFDDNIKFGDLAPIKDCKDLFGDMYSYINVIWKVIKIGIPIILVVLGTIDFAKIIFSGKEDEMKKAQEKFIKRIIIAVVIFIIPSLLSYLLEIANSIWGDTIGKDICGIIF